MEYWLHLFTQAQDKVSEKVKDEDYDRRYRFDEPWYSRHVLAMLYYDSLENKDVGTILDIGAGFGTIAVYSGWLFKNATIYTVDMVEKGLPFLGIRFRKMDIEYDDIPMGWPKKYERIIMTEVVEHLKHDPIITLKKINKMLSDSGVLYLSTPDAQEWGRVTKHYKHIGEMGPPDPENRIQLDEHIYQYTEGELRYILDKAGFEIKELHYSHPPSWGRHLCVKAVKK
jgi:2-polyprenyl-3-methyl-5-hydroxy-6-metoxy-1,4-benzoquinol methylase